MQRYIIAISNSNYSCFFFPQIIIIGIVLKTQLLQTIKFIKRRQNLLYITKVTLFYIRKKDDLILII